MFLLSLTPVLEESPEKTVANFRDRQLVVSNS